MIVASSAWAWFATCLSWPRFATARFSALLVLLTPRSPHHVGCAGSDISGVNKLKTIAASVRPDVACQRGLGKVDFMDMYKERSRK